MYSILIDGPAVEPVSLEDMKTYLRVDGDTDDDLISGLIKASRLMVEATARRILPEQRWHVKLDQWPADGKIVLPLSPLRSVDTVYIYDASGEANSVDQGSFAGDLLSDPPTLHVSNPPPPVRARNGIAIEVVAGYGAEPEDVPATLRLAMKIIVAHWYENRGDVEGLQELPATALALIAPFQRVRL